jgi:hypothetical protein
MAFSSFLVIIFDISSSLFILCWQEKQPLREVGTTATPRLLFDFHLYYVIRWNK